MEYGKDLCVGAFDWDDSALIKAYDRVMKTSKKALKSKGHDKNKENSAGDSATKPWKVGDYCQAVFNGDGLLYEAVIVAIVGNSCEVEFLGYGDHQETEIDGLLESNGSKARAKQRKITSKTESSADTDHSGGSRTKNANRRRRQGPRPYYESHYYPTPENLKQYDPIVASAINHSSVPPTTYIQRIAETASSSIPPPPMPPSAIGLDPALSAMLVSWYMAGYYTGLHQNQKPSQCFVPHKPRCCDHHGAPNYCNSGF